MTGKTPTDRAKEYCAIPLQSLRVNTTTNFDMYMKRKGPAGEDRYVLYRKRSIPFTEETRTTLAEHGTEDLYIDTSDRKEYQIYLEKNLDAVIADETIPIEKKSEIAYTCATGLVEEVLENPRSGEHIQRSKGVITNMIDYMLSESNAFFSLMATTSFDYYTYTHSVNVAVFGIALANRVGRFSTGEINTMGAGLILHDVGKGLIDKNILNKPGKLDDREWAIMKEHPITGAEMLKESGKVGKDELVVVVNHHEKLDGSGYPHGLKGDAIHPYARIAALADIFDALTTKRAYKDAVRSFPALKIMRDEMASKLDPELFQEFVQLMAGEDEKRRRPSSL
jgi:HD-GYP domain-containing protein (c-di-GMP phosphodiesterase class II)